MNFIRSWTVPIEVVNEAAKANQHWRIKSRRHNSQHFAVLHHLEEICAYRNQKIHVKLIRISPRMLDSEDNLPYSFKWIKDSLADMLIPGLQRGRADDSDLIDWSYAQEKGKPKEKGMRVEVYARD